MSRPYCALGAVEAISWYWRFPDRWSTWRHPTLRWVLCPQGVGRLWYRWGSLGQGSIGRAAEGEDLATPLRMKGGVGTPPPHHHHFGTFAWEKSTPGSGAETREPEHHILFRVPRPDLPFTCILGNIYSGKRGGQHTESNGMKPQTRPIMGHDCTGI